MLEPERQRMEGWLRKLLDLTLRNPLINLRPARGLAVAYPGPQELLSSLEKHDAGVRLRALPWSALPLGELERWKGNPSLWERGPEWAGVSSPSEDLYLLRDEATSKGSRVRRVGQIDASWEKTLSTFARADILVDSEPEDLVDDLVELDRQQKVRQQEGGVHTLYLALGLLRWKEANASAVWVESPLVLVPVALSRENAHADFFLTQRDEEVVLNPSLVHKLRQDFALDLKVELPEGGLGSLDLPALWEQVKSCIAPMTEWAVIQESRLSLFSFHKQHLWNDLTSRAELVLSHPVVAQIAGQLDDPARHEPVVDWEGLDEKFSPRDLLTPLPVDASQMRALTLVDEGHNLVIDGPPGTGKSQTITNLIAHALGKGKTILFVSEKATALSVVHDRLEELGLGAFCLDLHSAKAQKSEVVAQFKRTLDIRFQHDSEHWLKTADQLHAQRRELNSGLAALHEKRANGYSLFQAIGLFSSLSPPQPVLDIHMGGLREQSHADYEEVRKAVISWGRAYSMLPQGASRFAALSGRPLPEEEALFAAVDRALESVAHIENAFRALGRSAEALPLEAIQAWLTVFELGLDRPVSSDWAQWMMHATRADDVRTYHDAKRQWSQAWARVAPSFLPAVLAFLPQWLPIWNHARALGGIAGWWKKRQARQLLAEHTTAGKAPTESLVAQLLASFSIIQQSKTRLASVEQEVDQRLRRAVKSPTDWEMVLSAADWADRVIDKLEHLPVKVHADQVIMRDTLVNPPQALNAQWHAGAVRALEEFERSCAAWRQWWPAGQEGWPPEGREASLEAWRRHWQQWKHTRPTWPAWKHAELSAQKLRQAGLEPLIETAQHHRWSPSQVEQAWMAAYWRTWISQVQESIPQWHTLGRQREATIEDFSKLDAQVEHTTRDEILSRLCAAWHAKERVAPPAQMRVLTHEIGKKRSHLPPRQLLSKIPDLWPVMKPCLLMSPLSAAQHLGPDTPLFDLVVFDEASQISVADAIGVIARGRQVVIVGDPKQMPPSRLFDASEMEEDDDVVQDLDSILDECVAHMSRVLLNWHYRSRHEDLIAFSNHRYYNGELITFPSPNNRDEGVVVHDIKGGYERAGRRINRAEAEAVVNAVVDHVKQVGHVPSLGVITFNQNQQRLIQRMLDHRRATDLALDAALLALKEEVFVKNLETVQGDERDVIFFSTTFAPDAAGNFPMQFGPLGQLGGERRLNVAITRARERMEIFTSFHPSQMDVSQARHRGIKDLRDYLLFARGGEQALLSVAVPTLGVADSPFEVEVRKALQARGWEVVPQVGCSGYRIDMAVRHPDKPGHYLAGIECDGATYHSFKVARDRDRMRQRVLERLGWNIARIWSTDWWQDAAGEIDRIDEHLRQLRISS